MNRVVSTEQGKLTRWAIVLISALTIFRLWYCSRIGLLPDEMYYFLWSKHLDASYYSKGPAIAWTIAFGTRCFGDGPFGIRWLSVLLSAGTGWQLFVLARRLFDERVAYFSLLVVLVIPLFAIGSILMTIDPLSVFFWTWAANLFWSAVQRGLWRDWLLTGFAVGSGFLAKYVNAVELISFILFLAWHPAHRRWLRSAKFWSMLGVVVICTTPVFYWNAQHHWITVHHLEDRGNLSHGYQFHWKEELKFLQEQALVISPLPFLFIVTAVVLSVWKRSSEEPIRYLLALFAPLFLFYAIIGFNSSGEANWTAPAYVAGCILAGALAAEWLVKAGLLLKIGWGLSLVLVLALHHTDWLHLKHDPMERTHGWETIARHLQPMREGKPYVLISNRYQYASAISYYLPDRPTVYIPHSEKIQNQFSFWPTYELKPETRALLITDGDIPWGIKNEFSSIMPIGQCPREHCGKIIRQFWVYECSDPIMK